jgi:hypothetical protein
MSKKHNTKHERSPSRYKKRLADRGLSKAPRMKWTGLTTMQIVAAFAELPHYRWKDRVWVDDSGRKHVVAVREMIV